VTLDPDHCWEALATRDPRFDGVFFVAVSTTGIYCRPICPARTPRRDRCSFYRSAAEAESQGFRACLRCRPERAPGTASTDARSRLVRRAIRRLASGAVSVAGLAAGLGVTPRHLHRVFVEELGVPPTEVRDSHRVAVARQLLAQTTLPVADVARASGWRSERAFRDAFRARTRTSPTEARRPGAGRGDGIRVQLDTRPPFDSDLLLRFLAQRAFAGVEDVRDGSWTRNVRVGAHVGAICATPTDRGLTLEVDRSLLPVLAQVVAAVRRVFDLDARPDRVVAQLGADPLLAASVTARPGLRLPGAFDPFELAVRAVLGQQVSVAAATTLAGRLVARFGEPHADGRLFPAAAALGADPGALRALGLPQRRADCLAGLARAVDSGAVVLEADSDPDEVITSLEALPGIGPWTAAYVAMRGLGWPDAFPAGDLAVLRALGVQTAREAIARAETWRPWRAYAVMHLWSGT
jgi:AraC family transcriptional regulator of adaptative response / DNA-3-methyladenine glycosylase II